VAWDSGMREERSYVGPSVVIYRRDSNAAEVRYRHGDRLNSLDAVTDSTGNEIAADLHGYDPFGKPRGYDWRPKLGAAFERLHASEVGVTTNNGFTTHEHLDEVYLIHMNGRVYDYRMGRFLSVDPIISNPANSQSINPYSYIGNNPLSGVDPTGYVCIPVTGSHVCNEAPIGNLWINGNPVPGNVVSGPPSTAAATGNGAASQAPQAQPTTPSNAQSPAQAARAGMSLLLDFEFKRFKERLLNSAVLVTGGIVGTAQGLVPYAGLIDLPNVDPNFDLGRAFGLGLGGAWTANQGAGLAAVGAGAAALGGVGAPITLGGSLVLELPAGAAIAVGGAWAAGGVVNAVESGKLLSSMMRSSGDGGNAAPVGADGTAAEGGEPPGTGAVAPKAVERETKEAERALKKNQDFRRWFHREYKADQVSPKGGRNNPDLMPEQVRDAYQEWLESGKPKVK
jgi:RHS repeat-associated protein